MNQCVFHWMKLVQIQNYYKSEFKFDISRNAGRSGAHMEFEGGRKEHLERYPVWSTTLSIDYHNILEEEINLNERI